MITISKYDYEAEVVVVGYGGAGAVSAINAQSAGAKVLILEKQPSDIPTKTNHTPSTRMSGGNWLCPVDLEKTISYLEAMRSVANEALTAETKELISVFARYLVECTDWLKKMGAPVSADPMRNQTRFPGADGGVGKELRLQDGKVFIADFDELPGSECVVYDSMDVIGKYHTGAAFFKFLADAVESRKIPVLWNTPAARLITERGKVCGVVGNQGRKEVSVRARRAVVLTCGGFEFNETMKQNFLRTHPSHFYGNPGNTGEGVSMAMEVGAALWHMNNASWRVTMKFPDHPVAFGTQRHETASIFVDKRGKRFTNERFKIHTFGYELTNYDCYAMCYPKVPCYWIFDEKRRNLGPLASTRGISNPPGGVMGDIFYTWDKDSRKEIERGWIMKSDTLEGLAKKILADPDNNGLMDPSALKQTVKRFNGFCTKGKDEDFHKDPDWLKPLEDPPYYAVKLWPGGPNTQGGPKRNSRSQILRVDNTPVPRLYSAGELGSVWGMIYQGGGNLGELIAFGRIAGANAAAEKLLK